MNLIGIADVLLHLGMNHALSIFGAEIASCRIFKKLREGVTGVARIDVHWYCRCRRYQTGTQGSRHNARFPA
jgi:hypothetical protein